MKSQATSNTKKKSLSLAEGAFSAQAVAEALETSVSAVLMRYDALVKRFNRPPSITEMRKAPNKISAPFPIGDGHMTMPELAAATNLPEAIVRARYRKLKLRHPEGFDVTDLHLFQSRKRRAMTPRNAELIRRAREGETFTELAEAFGITRQAAHQIFKRGY